MKKNSFRSPDVISVGGHERLGRRLYILYGAHVTYCTQSCDISVARFDILIYYMYLVT